MDEENPGADRLRRINAAQQDVVKERTAETRPLTLSVDCKPGEENRRHRPTAWPALVSLAADELVIPEEIAEHSARAEDSASP